MHIRIKKFCCRSQDRKLLEDAVYVACNEVNSCRANVVFNDNLQKKTIVEDQPYNSFKTKNSFTTKPSSPLFSPVQRSTFDSEKNCEVFFENEISSRNDCWKHKVEIDSDNLGSSPQWCERNEKHRKRLTGTKYHVNGNTSESDAEERIKVVPLNTERLKPKREELKNVILSILDNGDVCVERLRNKSESRGSCKDEKVVVEVVRISKNGLKVSRLNVFQLI